MIIVIVDYQRYASLGLHDYVPVYPCGWVYKFVRLIEHLVVVFGRTLNLTVYGNIPVNISIDNLKDILLMLRLNVIKDLVFLLESNK